MPTRRQLRKEAVEEKRALLPEICVFNPFDEEVTRAAVEAQEKCSETRFERLRDQNAAVAAIQEATDRFAVTHRFAVKTAAKPSAVKFPLRNTCFKYTRQESGSLDEAQCRMEKGESVMLSLVHEDDCLIAYTITNLSEDQEEGEVKILDVDLYSRRKAGLSASITLEGEEFHVGAAHVALKRLLDELNIPLFTDATNHSSRYVFKSLGFVHDNSRSNPCILQFSP